VSDDLAIPPAGDTPAPLDVLLAAALAMADDVPVDWERAAEQAPELSESLANLRAIAAMAQEYQGDETLTQHDHVLFAWGSLQVLRRIGEGAFGEVFEAWDPGLQRHVALKLRRAASSGGSGTTLWLGEARRLARVRHDHVLQIHGADVHDGRAGLWTELLIGRTLEAILAADGPFSAREATLIGLDLCAALAAVHAAGLAHGDLKAGNVMRVGIAGADSRAAGRIVLMDFGTAHASSRPDPSEDAPGGVTGTPLSCAPEVLAGGALTPAADLYSLGVLLYRLVTSAYPVDAATLSELQAAHERGAQRAIRAIRPDLPAGFVQVVERALARDPAARFADAAEMERALSGTLGVTAVTRAGNASLTRTLLTAAAGAAAVALVWGAWRWVPEWTKPRFTLDHTAMPVAARAVQTLHGSEDLGLFGFSVACPGDIDGDGISDLVVGAPDESTSHGRVYLYHGRDDGTFSPWRTFTGDGQFGLCVTALGDFDGDGIPDFAVGAPYAVEGGSPKGGVWIMHGDRTAGAKVARVLRGPVGYCAFGYSIACAGDVDHDGHPDLIVGAPSDPLGGRGSGRAFLYRGGPAQRDSADVVFGPGERGAQLGIAVAGAGDMNGDGFSDVVVGANSERTAAHTGGHACVYFGGRAMDNVADLDLFGADEGGWFGIACTSLGDIDGDGFDDLAIGAERADGFEPRAGTVSIYRGGTNPSALPARVLRGPHSSSIFGHALAAADLDGDGRPDLVSGGYGKNEFGGVAGEAYAYRGGASLPESPALRLHGTDEAGCFATSLTMVPGRDGRFASLVSGAPYSGPTQSGAVWVFAISRYAITRPQEGAKWHAGTPEQLTWLGRERAVVEWADSAQAQWHELASGAGGGEENTASVTIPSGTTGRVWLRVRPVDRQQEHDAVLAPVTVR
jgi:hypothetical protein